MHFTEALHAELRGTGATATVLSPGVTQTGFLQRADLGKLHGVTLVTEQRITIEWLRATNHPVSLFSTPE